MDIPGMLAERYADLVDDREAFLLIMNEYLPHSFRVNTIKAAVADVLASFGEYGIEAKPMPFIKEGFVTGSQSVSQTVEHFAGHVYIQEAVSMIPPTLLSPKSCVLDACAAPGSKATQLSAMMGNRGLLVANDIDYFRIKALVHNIEKAGSLNVSVINRDVMHLKGSFDSILLDAPCSAEGTARKNQVLRGWSEKYIRVLSARQKGMILKCFDLLKPGGCMVYSTCTFAPEENESVISYLLEKRESAKLCDIEIERLKTCKGIGSWREMDFSHETRKAVRIWPHHNNTGGFFIAKVVRNE